MKDVEKTNVETKTEKLTKLFQEKIMPEIEDLLSARDNAQEQLNRLQDALKENQKKRETLQNDLNILVRDSVQSIAAGKGLGMKQDESRKVKAEMVEIDGWIVELEDAVSKAQAELDSAQNFLTEAALKAVTDLQAGQREEVNNRVRSAIDTCEACIGAIQSLCKSLKVQIPATYSAEITFFYEVIDDLRTFLPAKKAEVSSV